MTMISSHSNRSAKPPGLFREDLQRLLFQAGVVRQHEAGALIAASREGHERVWLMVSGAATVLVQGRHHREIAVDHLGPWDLFGGTRFVGADLSWPDAVLVAAQRSDVLEIPAEHFRELLSGHPEISSRLVDDLTDRVMRLHRALFESRRKKQLLQSLISPQERVFPDYVLSDYVRSRLTTRVEELAHTDGPVLIVGESGVGKEFVAHSIYGGSQDYKEIFLQLDLFSPRAQRFVRYSDREPDQLDADATTGQMRLLFGSEEITHDGKTREVPGYLDLSEEGTLLIRGAHLLTRAVQEELVTVIKTGTFRRYRGSTPIKARLRLVLTTRFPPMEIDQAEYPLIHGLSERSIAIPPLRRRCGEIPDLIDRYVGKYCKEFGQGIVEVPEETRRLLVAHSWPGNDMELAHTLRRAVLVSMGGVLRPKDIYFDLKTADSRGKFNLLNFKPIKKVLLSPLYPAILQSAAVPLFLIVVAFLFLGPADPMNNPAALFAWAVGWPGLILGAFLWARFWCSLCPIAALSRLAKKVVSFELPFPDFLKERSDFLIAAAVLSVIWFETATKIRDSPANLGFLLLAMLGSAIAAAVIFERETWCQHMCGMGGMVGVAAKASIVELRADRSVCMTHCRSTECYTGTGNRHGCPFGQTVPRLDSNRVCKLCGICVKNCPHDAIALNLRIPAKEIWEMRRANTGTAFLVIGMIGGLLSEMLSKAPLWGRLMAVLPFQPIGNFTIVFLGMLLAMNAMMVVVSAVSSKVHGNAFEENYCRHGLALIPLALTSFMAFHTYYLLHLGVQLPALLSQTLGMEVFRNLVIVVSPTTTHLVQVLLVVAGLAWTLMIVYRLGQASQRGLVRSLVGSLPHAAAAAIMAALILEGIESAFYQ